MGNSAGQKRRRRKSRRASSSRAGKKCGNKMNAPPLPANNNEPVLVLFAHLGIERDAFFRKRTTPKNTKNLSGKKKGSAAEPTSNIAHNNIVDNPLSLEVKLDDGKIWRGKGSVFGTPAGDQRYLMQTKAHVVVGQQQQQQQPRTKTVRFAAEYSGYAEEICNTSSDTTASGGLAKDLSSPWTKVMRPLLSSKYPLEAVIRDNDPFVLTAGAFRYGLCKQFSLQKMRTLPVGSVIVFCSMNRETCYLDTVFVVDKAADVVDEEVWQQNRKKKGDCSPVDHCTISEHPQDFKDHQGDAAWNPAIEQGRSKCKDLVDKATAEVLELLSEDFAHRNPSPTRLAHPPSQGKGPHSGRLYWGREYNAKDGNVPFSFVPVWEIGDGEEHCTEEHLMRPRPELDIKRLYKTIGSNDAPKPNAQMTSKPVGIGNTSTRNAIFDDIRQQVEEQGYDLGVKFAPPAAMDPQVEEKLSELQLDHIQLCESSFKDDDSITKGKLLSLDGRENEAWEVISLHMGPYIRVKSKSEPSTIEDWYMIGNSSNIINAHQQQYHIGTRVIKTFDGKEFRGKVIGFDYKEGYYKVRYEDDDDEEELDDYKMTRYLEASNR